MVGGVIDWINLEVDLFWVVLLGLLLFVVKSYLVLLNFLVVLKKKSVSYYCYLDGYDLWLIFNNVWLEESWY